jgi:hypothetical protein
MAARPWTLPRRHDPDARGRSTIAALCAVAILAVASAITADSATAQEMRLRDRVAFDALLGRQGLGIGLEVQLFDRLALVARAEGWPVARYSITGAGLRFDPVITDGVRFYAAGLIGFTNCNGPALDGPVRCFDFGERTALAGLGGLEILLGESRRWSAGIEGGYWYALKRDVASADLDHWTFAAIARWRPFQ